MKTKSFILLSLILSLGLLFAACDDDDSNNNSATCGNNIIEGDETCDGSALNGETCSTLNPQESGTLACKADCSGYDQTDCVEAECGNGIKDGNDQCDGDDLGGATCEDAGDYSGGTLDCNDDCTYDTSQCEAQCNVDGAFKDCDPTGGENECCDINNMAAICNTYQDGVTSECLQTCDNGPDCGWSMACGNIVTGACYFPICGGGAGGTPVREDCTIDTGRNGYCYPLWTATDDLGICFQNGTVPHEGTCNPEDLMGELSVDASTQCDMGICASGTGATEGICHDFCNPVEIINGDAADTCPENYNCINFSEIDTEAVVNGQANPYQYYRTPDYGICYPSVDGQNTVIDEGLLACNLITNYQTKDASSLCPTDTACKLVASGSIMGACASIDATAVVGEGEECDLQASGYQCGVGHGCFVYDPYNDPNIDNQDPGPFTGCNRFCDYDNGNEDCLGLETTDATPQPYECLSMSDYLGDGMQMPADENSPSRLGICVPPPAN